MPCRFWGTTRRPCSVMWMRRWGAEMGSPSFCREIVWPDFLGQVMKIKILRFFFEESHFQAPDLSMPPPLHIFFRPPFGPSFFSLGKTWKGFPDLFFMGGMIIPKTRRLGDGSLRRFLIFYPDEPGRKKILNLTWRAYWIGCFKQQCYFIPTLYMIPCMTTGLWRDHKGVKGFEATEGKGGRTPVFFLRSDVNPNRCGKTNVWCRTVSHQNVLTNFHLPVPKCLEMRNTYDIIMSMKRMKRYVLIETDFCLAYSIHLPNIDIILYSSL